jgi:hypothetical protein
MERAPRSFAQARDLVAATPTTRNRYVDLLRVASIAVVVLGHWTIAVLGYRAGKFSGSNLLELNPDLQVVTWVFQVMPLFFIVGGFTNCPSWSSAQARGVRYADWLRGRSVRLLRPAIWFVAFWTLIPVVGVEAGLLPASVARTGGEEVALPLWFLAVYLLVMLAVPPLVAAHRRFGGVQVFVTLVVVAFVVDNLHFGLDLPVVGALNYATIWLALLELGYLWREGKLDAPRWLPWAMIVLGLGSLLAMVTWFDYPVSMIGLTHAPRSNAQPPSLALLALGVWQLGAALLFQAPANRWLQRTRAWTAVIVANSMVMTFYLWNMSAVVLAALLLFRTGIGPQPEPLGTAWWLLRPAWWLACAICLLPFLFGFRWAERPVGPPPLARDGTLGDVLVVGGTILAGAGLALLAAKAFPVPGSVVALPALGLALVALGALAVGVDPIAPLRRQPREAEATRSETNPT